MSTVVENAFFPLAKRHSRSSSLLAIAAYVVLFSVGGIYEAVHQASLSSISNSNFWEHLRTGLWILQKHAVPHTGIYSQSPDTPWRATSWLYDVALGVGSKCFDVRIAPILLACFRLLLAIVTFLLGGGRRGRFWTAIVLSAAAQYILGALQPGPGYISLLLFAVVLLLIMESRRSDRVRSLFLLPPLFLLWANLDIDFVCGILLLLLWFAATLLENHFQFFDQGLPGRQIAASPKTTVFVVLLALMATGITPYFFRQYAVFVAMATSAANRYLPDYHAICFRKPEDYLLLLLTMAAFLALGLRRSRDPFQLTLLVVCSMLSFHLHSYSWLAVLASLAVIGDVPLARGFDAGALCGRSSGSQLLIPAGLALVIIVSALATFLAHSRQALLAKMSVSYPMAAADYIRDHHLPQPLFNDYQWGGFLMWYLPDYPVAIDGRVELYNNDANIQYAKFVNSQLPINAYRPIMRARTVLLEPNSIQAQVLKGLSGYKPVYSDDVSTVLLHEGAAP